MLKDGKINRFFIRVSILGLRAIAPASTLYCLLRLVLPLTKPALINSSLSRALIPLDIYCTIEIVFFIGVSCYRRYLDRASPPFTPLDTPASRLKCLKQAFSATPEPASYLSGWFYGADLDLVHADDLKDFLFWRLWNHTDRASLTTDEEDEVSSYLTLTEEITGIDFPAGRGKHKAMAVTMEPMRVTHRPLFWYMFLVGGADVQLTLNLRVLTPFQFHSAPRATTLTTIPFRPATLFNSYRSPVRHLSYWHIQHTSRTHLPILFIHGIGVGMHFYLAFLHNFLTRHNVSDGQIGLIALEYMPICNRITHPILSKATIADEIHTILHKHKWSKCVLVTHSYGSLIAAHLLKSPITKDSIGPLVFVDPVAFSFHTSTVPYNFLRRKPKSASEWQLWYFASTDLMVAHALSRGFGFWGESSLWRGDVDVGRGWRCATLLAGRDIVTDTETLGRWFVRGEGRGEWWKEDGDVRSEELKNWEALKKKGRGEGECGVEVLWFEECNHSEIFDKDEDRKRLLDLMLDYSRNGKVSRRPNGRLIDVEDDEGGE